MIFILTSSRKREFRPNVSISDSISCETPKFSFHFKWFLQIRRIIKITCNSTGVICPKAYCRFKLLAINQPFANFGCETFNGPMIPMLVSLNRKSMIFDFRNYFFWRFSTAWHSPSSLSWHKTFYRCSRSSILMHVTLSTILTNIQFWKMEWNLLEEICQA